jgi:hypothetical protein
LVKYPGKRDISLEAALSGDLGYCKRFDGKVKQPCRPWGGMVYSSVRKGTD